MGNEGYEKLFRLFEKFVSSGLRVLEVGCGHGEILEKLTKQYRLISTGVDPYISAKVRQNVRYVPIKGEEITALRQTFEIIFTVLSLHHLRDEKKFFEEAKSVLDKNGKLIIVDWKKGASTGVPEHYFTLGEITSQLKKNGFKIIDSGEEQNIFYIVAEK